LNKNYNNPRIEFYIALLELKFNKLLIICCCHPRILCINWKSSFSNKSSMQSYVFTRCIERLIFTALPVRVSIFFHLRSPDNFTISHDTREWYRFIVLAFIIRFRLYDQPAAHLLWTAPSALPCPLVPIELYPCLHLWKLARFAYRFILKYYCIVCRYTRNKTLTKMFVSL